MSEKTLPKLDINKENGEIGAVFLEMYEFHKEWMEHYANEYLNAIRQNKDRLLKEFDKKQAREDIILKSGGNKL